jgi:hypothetical protein
MRRGTLALSLAATAVAVAGAGVLTALPASAAVGCRVAYQVSPSDAVWVDSGQWPSWTNYGYILYNELWARSGTNWGVVALVAAGVPTPSRRAGPAGPGPAARAGPDAAGQR